MSWQDDMKVHGYTQAALNANNDRELEQGMQAVDKGVELIGDVLNGIGKALTEPSPPPPKSSGVGLGGLLATGAVVGTLYLIDKFLGSNDNENKNINPENQQIQPKPSTQPQISQAQSIVPANTNKVNKKRQKSEPSPQFKSELSNIKGLISNPKSNIAKIKELLHKLEVEIEPYHDGRAMKKVAEYYQKINCDYESQRCYNKAEMFEEEYKRELEKAEKKIKQVDSYFTSGNDYLKQQKYEQAIRCYDDVIQLNPNYSLAYKNRGKCYQALGDNKKAQSDFSKAKELRRKG